MFYGLLYTWLAQSHNLCHEFDGLTLLTWVFFLFFNLYLFLVFSFNIRLIEN